MRPDVIIVGAGLIGLTMARELQARGMRVEVWDQSQAGHESSWAAAGMLAGTMLSLNRRLRPAAQASLTLYPEFIAQLETETGQKTGYRASGTLLLAPADEENIFRRDFSGLDGVDWLSPSDVEALEPELQYSGTVALLSRDHSVNSRQLVTACRTSAALRGIPIHEGRQVTRLHALPGGTWSVESEKHRQVVAHVINAAGAWAGQIDLPQPACPVRPVKGQALQVEAAPWQLRHVIIAQDFYLVPRAAGSILVGATQEEAGFDKSVCPEQLSQLQARARACVPILKNAPVVEMWAGLRPATPDGLPLLGASGYPGYWLAAGHFREGILLAPWTAHTMANLLADLPVPAEVAAFSPARFQ